MSLFLRSTSTKRTFFLRPLLMVGLGLLGIMAATLPAQTAQADDAPLPAGLIEEGHYQAILGDCAACHTQPGRPAYSGGMPFKLPIGTIYSTNISPDPVHGIGRYTEAEFARAVQLGIRKDGSALYPAMPYPSYARLSKADIHALYVYFQRGVTPQPVDPPANGIIWPLSMRWPLHIWRWLFSPSIQSAQHRTNNQFSDPVLARGAYLVEGPGHCGACHSPRSIALNEKAQTAKDGPLFLSGGGVVEQWVVPSIRQENRTGLGRWSEQDIVDFLRTGRARTGASFGGMTPVIVHSAHAFKDDDLHAIARYLMLLAPARKETPWVYDPSTADMLRRADMSQPGAQTYMDRCAACHRTDGAGYGTVFPPLAGNPVVMTDDATSLIHIVLAGDNTHALHTSPSAFTMPGFANTLSDKEVADVVSFIRKSWGNNNKGVKEGAVRRIRHSMPQPATPEQLPKN